MNRLSQTKDYLIFWIGQMNKAIVFDLDGVLVDSKRVHFDALNKALADVNQKFVITKKEQQSTYEGLTTKSKLDILTMTKGLPKTFHELIWKSKQEYSSEIFKKMPTDKELVLIFNYIKEHNIKIGVASNAIRKTLDTCLDSIGVADLIDFSLSNEDVVNPKPNPEIYLSMMTALGSDHFSTIIFEDSSVGKQAATASGAILFPVNKRQDINKELIEKAIKTLGY